MHGVTSLLHEALDIVQNWDVLMRRLSTHGRQIKWDRWLVVWFPWEDWLISNWYKVRHSIEIFNPLISVVTKNIFFLVRKIDRAVLKLQYVDSRFVDPVDIVRILSKLLKNCGPLRYDQFTLWILVNGIATNLMRPLTVHLDLMIFNCKVVFLSFFFLFLCKSCDVLLLSLYIKERNQFWFRDFLRRLRSNAHKLLITQSIEVSYSWPQW